MAGAVPHINEIKIILNAFEDAGITPYQFLHGILATNIFQDHPVTESIIEDLNLILNDLASAHSTADKAIQWAFRSAEKGYQKQVLELTAKESGFCFSPGKIMEV
ncbi:hypothetical protein BYT27DRAFT_7257226 [Phlegmacium glaucopus]|nr:hypothetical protein BYT27DRAFT_7257226 [Phlegmacium glaucopus]